MLGILFQVPRFEGCPYLLPNPKTLKPFNTVYFAWNLARTRAGLADLRMHDLRHSFASFLINANRSLYEIQSILGHTQISTTQRYAHLTQKTLVEAANAVDGVIDWS
jgi:site-specific recombinase XerD